MDEVKIKKIKRQHKKASLKEKILAGFGTLSSLAGTGAGIADDNKPVAVTTENNDTASSKIKQAIADVFGIPVAKADFEEGLMTEPVSEEAQSSPEAAAVPVATTVQASRMGRVITRTLTLDTASVTPRATGVTIADLVQSGGQGSFNVIVEGENLDQQMFFDIRFTGPGSDQEQTVLNWQQGARKGYTFDSTFAPGVYTITALRVHLDSAGSSGEFVPIKTVFEIKAPEAPQVKTFTQVSYASMSSAQQAVSTIVAVGLATDPAVEVSPGLIILQDVNAVNVIHKDAGFEGTVGGFYVSPSNLELVVSQLRQSASSTGTPLESRAFYSFALNKGLINPNGSLTAMGSQYGLTIATKESAAHEYDHLLFHTNQDFQSKVIAEYNKLSFSDQFSFVYTLTVLNKDLYGDNDALGIITEWHAYNTALQNPQDTAGLGMLRDTIETKGKLDQVLTGYFSLHDPRYTGVEEGDLIKHPIEFKSNGDGTWTVKLFNTSIIGEDEFEKNLLYSFTFSDAEIKVFTQALADAHKDLMKTSVANLDYNLTTLTYLRAVSAYQGYSDPFSNPNITDIGKDVDLGNGFKRYTFKDSSSMLSDPTGRITYFRANSPYPVYVTPVADDGTYEVYLSDGTALVINAATNKVMKRLGPSAIVTTPRPGEVPTVPVDGPDSQPAIPPIPGPVSQPVDANPPGPEPTANVSATVNVIGIVDLSTLSVSSGGVLSKYDFNTLQLVKFGNGTGGIFDSSGRSLLTIDSQARLFADFPATDPTAIVAVPEYLQKMIDLNDMEVMHLGDPSNPAGWVTRVRGTGFTYVWTAQGTLIQSLNIKAAGVYEYYNIPELSAPEPEQDTGTYIRANRPRDDDWWNNSPMPSAPVLPTNPTPTPPPPTEDVTATINYSPSLTPPGDNGVQTQISKARAAETKVMSLESEPAAVQGEALAPLLNNERFVGKLYSAILGREADADGLNYWTNILNLGEQDRVALVQAFLESPEAQGLNLSNQEFLNNLYSGIHGRAADVQGNAFWLSALESGQSRDSVAASFLSSEELKQDSFSQAN